MKKKSVVDRIKYYKSQGLTVADLFQDPIINGMEPDEINKYHDDICDLAGNKIITNPVVLKAIEAAERGEGEEWVLPDPKDD